MEFPGVAFCAIALWAVAFRAVISPVPAFAAREFPDFFFPDFFFPAFVAEVEEVTEVVGLVPAVVSEVASSRPTPLSRGRFFCTGARILDSSAHEAEVTTGHSMRTPTPGTAVDHSSALGREARIGRSAT
ncbi:hypothetical protein ACFV94_10740 [Streptomyces sp. NPDC059896]|uniref:hypothetical protein n=1 Tax=Streptomyces sp. NPDC059896 TaxID=3346993 RepID=UPI00365D82A9